MDTWVDHEIESYRLAWNGKNVTRNAKEQGMEITKGTDIRRKTHEYPIFVSGKGVGKYRSF